MRGRAVRGARRVFYAFIDVTFALTGIEAAHPPGLACSPRCCAGAAVHALSACRAVRTISASTRASIAWWRPCVRLGGPPLPSRAMIARILSCACMDPT